MKNELRWGKQEMEEEEMGGKRERDTGMREREKISIENLNSLRNCFSIFYIFFMRAESRAMKENCKFMWFEEMLALLLGSERERCLQDDKIFTVFPWDFPQIFFWSQIIEAFKVI